MFDFVAQTEDLNDKFPLQNFHGKIKINNNAESE